LKIIASEKKKLPFLKKERVVRLTDAISKRSVKDLFAEVSIIFQEEKLDLLSLPKNFELTNLRGRPVSQNGIETGDEILVKIGCSIPKGANVGNDSEESNILNFEPSVTSKFREFLDGKIIYTAQVKIPSGLEVSSLKELLKREDCNFNFLEVSFDLFETKNFSLLGTLLQELRERVFITFSKLAGSTSSFALQVENNNYSDSKGFSERLRIKLEALEKISEIDGLCTGILKAVS